MKSKNEENKIEMGLKENQENVINVAEIKKNNIDNNNTNKREEQIIENKESQLIEDKIEYKETPYRIVIIIVYFLLNFANGLQWVTYSAISEKFMIFYDQTENQVSLYSLIFMIVYPFVCIPESYLIDNINMRLGLSLAAVTMIIGSFLKYFTNSSFAWAYIGQVLSSLFQPAILNSPAKIASIWCKDDKRALVTSICCLSNTLGVMFGFIYHVFFIDDDKYKLDSNVCVPSQDLIDNYKKDVKNYLLWEFIVTTVLSIPSLIFLRNKPDVPVSPSQNKYESPPLVESLKLLFKNKDFVILLISFTFIVGLWNMYGTIFNQYMILYNINDDQGSYASAAANFIGMVAALVSSIILDKTKKFRTLLLICNLVSLVFMGLLTFILEIIKSKTPRYVCLIIIYCITTSFLLPIYTNGMDYVCELTYPVGESQSGGLIMSLNQIWGIVMVLVGNALVSYCKNQVKRDNCGKVSFATVSEEELQKLNGRFILNILSCINILGSLISLWFIKDRLVRTNKELGKEGNNSNIETNGVKVDNKEENKENVDKKENKD